MKKLFHIFFFLSQLSLLSGCGVVSYSFSGTSIEADVQTCAIEYFENKAMMVNPSLSNNLSEALIDQFTRLTRLEIVTEAGDLNISGEIVSYNVTPMAITAEEVASQNRLTIGIRITYTNRLYPDKDFEKSLSAYADYDSMQSLDSVESQLCDEIIEILVEDIFNATVANW